ncbi:MAG: hypothetical protein QJR03_02460 [Sphaerobacter sp.]|nr:hypothetical protein [Sphaerobacter sp.]
MADRTEPTTTRLAARAAAYGLGTGLAVLLLVGIPTVLIPNPWFSRMVPTRPRDYLFLALTVLLSGLLGTTYAFPAACPLQEGKLTAGGFLSFLAVGCPVCNKLVLLALGTNGALRYFEPAQPLLALAGLATLGYALAVRLRAVRHAWQLPPT